MAQHGVLVIVAGIMRMLWAFGIKTFGKGVLMFELGGLTLLCGLSLVSDPLFAFGFLSVLRATYPENTSPVRLTPPRWPGIERCDIESSTSPMTSIELEERCIFRLDPWGSTQCCEDAWLERFALRE